MISADYLKKCERSVKREGLGCREGENEKNRFATTSVYLSVCTITAWISFIVQTKMKQAEPGSRLFQDLAEILYLVNLFLDFSGFFHPW
jgi:hypothetical protein